MIQILRLTRSKRTESSSKSTEDFRQNGAQAKPVLRKSDPPRQGPLLAIRLAVHPMHYWIPALLALKCALTAPSVKIVNGTLHGMNLKAPFEQDSGVGVTDEGWDATSYGRSCPQYGAFCAREYQSEDCLTLNVVRPNIDLRDLPVLVWIYGGGFSGGSTFSPVYNLRYIVQESIELGEPIIAVSIIYRLPTFGFLASAEVVASGNANLGLRDQHLALPLDTGEYRVFWRRSKHSHESAGAYSVGLQALAYGGGKDGETDLFRGAIYESGAALGSCADDVEHTQASYDDIVHQIGCDSSFDTLDCLRATPYDVLYTAYALKFGFGPVVDGAFIPDFPSKLLSTGQLDTNIVGLVGANTV
ncbi:Alpha/Beta hydrolase protein [Mucidula mucida]|nr:Alpha/Beta hydrolase protein [Mucidula mucida]